jgi:hypothetical protein
VKLWILLAAVATVQAQALTPEHRSQVERYCTDCHDADVKKGGIDLASILDEGAGKHAEVWEEVLKQLSVRHMPPVGKKRPDEQGYTTLSQALAAELDSRILQPVRGPALRRLTRTEYQYAVRDLLAVEFDAKAAFPADEVSHGFDNITVGDLPPALLDRYISAAQRIAKQAVGISTEPEITAVRVRPDITQEHHVPGLPLGTRGGVLIPHVFTQDGEYEVQVRLQRDRNEKVEGMQGQHRLQVLLDREMKAEFAVKPTRDHEQLDAHLKTRFQVKGGQHDLGVTFVPKGSPVLERLRQPYHVSYNFHRHPRLNPAVYQVTITGPFNATGPGVTPSRKLLFPAGVTDPDALLRPVLQRAWRRAITPADLQRFQPFFDDAGSLHAGMELALSAILVSREFLFRKQPEPLSSKLSFFLWSSLPDDELLSTQPPDLAKQTRRMLADPRAEALVLNFADQWLYLRNLDSALPDARLFPDFDHNLRESLCSETRRLFQSIIQEDRSVLDLLQTDRTWMNERLAAHYGIPHIQGSRMREVKLQPEWQRGGLLRHGSLLTVTSYATRTSPVIRGHWVLKNLLAAEPPPPPPNIPALDGVISDSLPIRQRLAMHRENAACASCHHLMDPIGFAFEHYDALGRWQDQADANGGFADGTTFDGVAGLEQTLLKRPELFVTAVTEKLLVYALGRGLEPEDGPAVRSIVKQAKAKNWRFSEVILGVVTKLATDPS